MVTSLLWRKPSETQTPSAPTELPSAHSQLLSATTSSSSQIVTSLLVRKASATQTPSTPTELPSAHSQLLSAATSSSSQTVTSLLSLARLTKPASVVETLRTRKTLKAIKINFCIFTNQLLLILPRKG